MTCDYAGCDRPGPHGDQDWHFCKPHYYEHLQFLREEAARDCASCFTPFVSTNPRRTHCDDCRRADRQRDRARLTPQQWQRQAGAS